ncbi:signal peptide containing protein [Theileria equi strain WA]|uniref:Signal peptide containing protein n=1 Tax=Theileria equi strain WA TaxID=1537102 RepID=L1LAU1_THEEQ|nr:signal peptide containing protein [Theileria equi strain WA]EKX72446.1 signal peptide containing protein [Theileria equi strain WA]|eukprot:XP_004831898.1 signal peptide containing protein [Theileria equi strain WA]
MRTSILLSLLFILRFGEAGWPSCLGGCMQREEENEAIASGHLGPPPGIISVTLDLENPNRCEIHVQEKKKGKVKQKDYFPRKCYRITSVTCGTQVLWRIGETEEEKCQFVERYIKKNTEIVTLNIAKGREFEPLCFERTASGWISMNIRQFFDKLGGLRCGDDDEQPDCKGDEGMRTE